MSKVYNVGIYCRLSIDDAGNSQKYNYIDGDESSSIENQRQMLSQFAKLQGWIVTKTYCDDGYSGGNMDRPGVKEMIEDAKTGVINLILCKDLSRFGRDYIEVGQYTDVLFPLWRCRFIALLDEIDTAKDDNDMMHFRSLMNDYYLKDLSNKIKTVFRAKINKHGLITGRPPYGYRRSADNKHLLIPDEQAAKVIQYIFSLRSSGMSYAKIAGTLNQEGFLTANDYWTKVEGKEIEKPALWSVQVVRDSLRNEAYSGTIINNKMPTISHKSTDRKITAPDEWIRHENAHAPIIDRDTWDKVQVMEQATIERGKKQSKHKPSLFGGKLICMDCGSSLTAQSMGHTKNGVWKRDGTSYICHRRVMTGKVVCSNHTIGEAPLKKLILRELQEHAQAITLNEAALLETLKKRMAVDDTQQHRLLQKEVAKLNQRLAELTKITVDLYEDKVSGVISETTFISLMNKNEQERQRWQTQFDEANGSLTAIDKKILSVEKWAEVIRKHMSLTDLCRADVEELIDHIVVGESDYSSGHRVQEIRIFWRFVGCLAD